MWWCILTFSLRNVIWLADTNYRIELDNDRVRQLAQSDDYDALLSADQVSTIIDRGHHVAHVRFVAAKSHGRRRGIRGVHGGSLAVRSYLQVRLR